MDAIEHFSNHVVTNHYEDIPCDAVNAVKTFLLDSIGVGMSGVKGQWSESLGDCLSGWGQSSDSRVIGRSTTHPCAVAALANAFQIHNSEFDCVHEGAVVHPMASILGASLAVLDRKGGVSGKQLIEAIALGVNVSCGIGVGSKAPLRFFRPGSAGGFGATAAVGKLLGFDNETLMSAFGTFYGQSCGTMQSHEEGSMLLALQIGFNTRNAVFACDMAEKGLLAPRNILEGKYGYYPLFEGDYDISPVIAQLNDVWRITEVSHKPYPTGRATQGVIEGVIFLKNEHDLSLKQIKEIKAYVTPLTKRLVGRPLIKGMQPNYARLCLQYCVARALLRGTLDLTDFHVDALNDDFIFDFSKKITINERPNDDPNALGPSSVEVTLVDGRSFNIDIDRMLGSPFKPLSRNQQIQKFLSNWNVAAKTNNDEKAFEVIKLIDNIENLSDTRELLSLISIGS